MILSAASPWPGAPSGFSPPFEGTVALPSPDGPVDWRILALDTQDDGARAYDTFLLASPDDGEPAAGLEAPQLHPDAWSRLPVFGRSAPPLFLTVTGQQMLTHTLSFSPTQGLTPTATLSPTTALTPTLAVTSSLELGLYQIAAQEVAARPETLGQAVTDRFGFCPPLPDPATVARGQLSAEAFAELAASRARWSGWVAAYVYETARPHLMLIRQEALFAAEEALLLRDPRQPGYSQARVDEFAAHRRTVAAAADIGLNEFLVAVDLNHITVLAVSEHGTAPVHTQVNVAAARQSVLRLLNEMDERGLSRAEATLHLHAQGGFLSIEVETSAAETTVVRNAIVDTLASLVDPQTSEPVFARVAPIEEAETWAEAWPYPGEVIAQARPGYALMVAKERFPVFAEAGVYGQPGYDAALTTMRGAIIAAGQGISEGSTPPARLQEVAPLLAQWLALTHWP